MSTPMDEMKHTDGKLSFEDRPGSGLQIMGMIGDPVSRREFCEFRLRGDKPVPLFTVAYDQWMQFPNPEWNEMQKANGIRLVACWNACIGLPTSTLELAAGDAPNAAEWFRDWSALPAEAHELGVKEWVESIQRLLIARTAALLECRDYFDGRADADQPSGSAPIANEEMVLLVKIDAALTEVKHEQR